MHPLALHAAVVLTLAAAMLAVSYLLGERHQERATNEPYESGIVPASPATLRFPAHFYLVALLFVIFDLEAVFLFAWAVAAPELGWAGYFGMLVFLFLLVAGLVYEWRQGALDWGWSGAARERARAALESSRRPR